MSNDEFLTDDFVGDLLAKEAKDCSLKYSAMGMEAFRTDKKPENLPKPNTRFLRHIIKDTDAHNKALLAKEAAESKARLGHLERTEQVKRQKSNPDARSTRRRQMGDIQAILGGGRRRRTDDAEPTNGERSNERGTRSRDEGHSSRRDEDLIRIRRDEGRHHGRLSRTDGDDRKDRSHRRRRSRERDSAPEGDGKRRHGRSQRDRSRSPRRRRSSRSPEGQSRRHRHRSPLQQRVKGSPAQSPKEADDSDPLEDFIGPSPPPKYKGRGALAGSSGIDRRFSETYDPKTDSAAPTDEPGDWDDAVEAFRDRQKLKMNQEERMRAAGFATEQIQKLTAGPEEPEALVRWSKAGEKREWDRGKVDGTDGTDGVFGGFSSDEL